MEKIEDGNVIGPINGTVAGDAQLVVGKKGLALHVSGNDQYVEFGNQADICLGYFILCTRGWVAAFWGKLKVPGRMMDTGYSARHGQQIFWWYPGILYVLFADDNNNWMVQAAASAEQGWIHVVATWRRCIGATLYINGELVDTSATAHPHTTPISGTTCFIFGGDCLYSATGFDGFVDELRVWDAVMDDGDVLKLYSEDAGFG